jgi:phosphinothricin acetyltransferase
MAMSDPRIRAVRAEDARDIQSIYAPYVRDTVISFELEPPSVEEMAARVAAIVPVFPWLAWEEDGRVAGYAYASRHSDRPAYQWSVNVSAYVHRDFHRRGIGGALYRDLLAILRRHGFVNAYGGITLPNAASVALHESVGFAPLCVYRGVGFKMGRWHDVGWWHLRLADLPSDPSPPTKWGQVGF